MASETPLRERKRKTIIDSRGERCSKHPYAQSLCHQDALLQTSSLADRPRTFQERYHTGMKVTVGVERQRPVLIGRHIAGGTNPAYDTPSHPMTHKSISHRHRLDKVCTHILSLLPATTRCCRHVL